MTAIDSVFLYMPASYILVNIFCVSVPSPQINSEDIYHFLW